MTDKPKNIMIRGTVAVLVLFAAAWFFYQKPAQQQEIEQAGAALETGIALFNEKKYTEALGILENVPSGNPHAWRARYYQGSALIKLKDFEAALAPLEQALALNPTGTRIMRALGVAYYKLGNIRLSRAYYASVLEIDPTDEEAKGLMDIMARLERQSSSSSPEPVREDSG